MVVLKFQNYTWIFCKKENYVFYVVEMCKQVHKICQSSFQFLKKQKLFKVSKIALIDIALT